jgi:methenyltetrahydrofolate cyclohydrolase
MKDYADLPLREFLEDTAARQPTPGGGSCAALVGAIGAGLAQMAARYTLNNDRYKAHHPDVARIVEQLSRVERMFRDLMVEDMAAYEASASASKTRTGSPDEQEQYHLAMLTATAVPLEIVTTATAALRAMAELKDKCSRSLLSDLISAAWITEAAARTAAENVRGNLPRLPDPAKSPEIERVLGEQMAHVSALRSTLTG